MLKVLTAGLWTSIQDKGRFGSRHLGVPVSGLMDSCSAKLANLLLNNESNAAVMEISLSGPEILFMADTCIAITGADMSAEINHISVPLNTSVNISAGDKLSFGHLHYGARSYLAVKHGFKTAIELDSRSFYSSITSRFKLQKGQMIDYLDCGQHKLKSNPTVKSDQRHFVDKTLAVSKGPEFNKLSEEEKSRLLECFFSVSNNNRMGYHLNELLDNQLKSILTSAVFPGTVQLTPDGKLIILMRDCQTTGGYPRVLQLNENAINCLSQKKLNDKIQFKLLD